MLSGCVWAFQMLSITFGLSALLFYYMLYQSKLIPHFISIWGLIGAVAVWLIVKGFNPSAIVAEPAKQ